MHLHYSRGPRRKMKTFPRKRSRPTTVGREGPWWELCVLFLLHTHTHPMLSPGVVGLHLHSSGRRWTWKQQPFYSPPIPKVLHCQFYFIETKCSLSLTKKGSPSKSSCFDSSSNSRQHIPVLEASIRQGSWEENKPKDKRQKEKKSWCTSLFTLLDPAGLLSILLLTEWTARHSRIAATTCILTFILSFQKRSSHKSNKRKEERKHTQKETREREVLCQNARWVILFLHPAVDSLDPPSLHDAQVRLGILFASPVRLVQVYNVKLSSFLSSLTIITKSRLLLLSCNTIWTKTRWRTKWRKKKIG